MSDNDFLVDWKAAARFAAIRENNALERVESLTALVDEIRALVERNPVNVAFLVQRAIDRWDAENGGANER